MPRIIELIYINQPSDDEILHWTGYNQQYNWTKNGIENATYERIKYGALTGRIFGVINEKFPLSKGENYFGPRSRIDKGCDDILKNFYEEFYELEVPLASIYSLIPLDPQDIVGNIPEKIAIGNLSFDGDLRTYLCEGPFAGRSPHIDLIQEGKIIKKSETPIYYSPACLEYDQLLWNIRKKR
jgi:hypothetical protein